MSNNQTEYTKERKKEERRQQHKRKEQRILREEHPDYSRSKQREKNQLAVEEWYLNQIPSIVDFDIELTPSKIEELREYGNRLLAGYDFTPKSVRETLLRYDTPGNTKGKDILHDMYIFREAYRKGRTLQEYKQRLQDYQHGTLAFDIDHEYRLHDMEPVLDSLPLDFGKIDENNIHRECEEESVSEDEASSDKANEDDSDSKDEGSSDTETEEGLDGGEKHSKEKETEEESHRENNKKENEVEEDWVVDDYIVIDDDIDWNVFDNRTKYKTLISIAKDSKEQLNLAVNFGNILCENVATCEWCFKHWHGGELRSISLPRSEQGLKQWSAVFSQTPKDIADVLERKTKTTRVDELAEILEDYTYRSEAEWEYDNVCSICQYVMHELHPEGVHYFHCHEHDEFQDHETKFDNSAKFIIVIVMESKECQHFNHYVFDLQKGCCDVKDPTYYETECEERKVQYESHGKVSTNVGIIQ